MDPDKVLEDLRKAVAEWEDGPPANGDAAADEMAACFNSLDEWIQMGGFLPKAWSNR